MASELEIILTQLDAHSRKGFLEATYSPGNNEVINAVLAENCFYDDMMLNLIRREIQFTKENRPKEEFERLSRRVIDAIVNSTSSYDIIDSKGEQLVQRVLSKLLVECNDKTLVRYTIDSILNLDKAEGKSKEISLTCAADLAELIEEKQEAANYLQQLLDMREQKSTTFARYGSLSTMDIYIKLGRNKEAVNAYLSSHSKGDIESAKKAFDIAKNRFHEEAKAIAEIGFNKFRIEENTYDKLNIFIEFAEFLGRTDNAKERLMEYTDHILEKVPAKLSNINPFGENCSKLTDALGALGLTGQVAYIKNLVARGIEVSGTENPKLSEADFDRFTSAIMDLSIFLNRVEEYYRFLVKIGKPEEIGKASESRESQIYGIAESAEGIRSDALDTVFMLERKCACKYSKDPIILKKLMLQFENEQNYVAAEVTAMKIGDTEMASVYRAAQRMIANKGKSN